MQEATSGSASFLAWLLGALSGGPLALWENTGPDSDPDGNLTGQSLGLGLHA